MSKSFTLVELIFVIVVIGILAAIALPKFNDTRQAAISSAIQQDVTTITNSIKSKYMISGDILDIGNVVDFNTDVWELDSTKLILKYKISEIVCVEIKIDKSTSSHELQVVILPDSHLVCQKIYDNGLINKTELLY